MSSIVEVKLELGHRAKVREVQHPNGYTHDWVVFVKGTDGIKLEHFVEKVVFWLHESYEPNKVVLKQPPYKFAQSGFAGFNMLIYIHFRNREEPKMVRFEYDLFLHTQLMPPVNHTRLEKLTFTNPTEDFRKKLLRAGAQLINQSADASKNRSASKDKSGAVISPVSKKEKSRSSSKQREGSSSRNEDRKRSGSHSKKDTARIPAKDIKRHDENFKQPLPAKSGKEPDSGNNKVNTQQERGRSEKRRSVADDDDEVGRKKKKKRSEDFSSKSPSMSSASTQQKKDKERIRKIKEQADVVAGLFAPENSINMTQIKKEKTKQEDSRTIKKEKTPNRTPTRTVPSPHPVQEDAQHISKISPGGNLTLKIKKERITSGEKERKFNKESSNSLTKRRDSVDKEKRKYKGAKAQTRVEKIKVEIKKSPPTSSNSSSSDMDISESESSNDEKHERNKIRTSPAKFHNSSKQIEKVENKPKSINTSKASESKFTKTSLKTESNKSESNRSFKNSPAHSKHSEKEKHKVDTFRNKKSSSSKHKKSSKEREHTLTSNKECVKHKKQKRLSKEKLVKQSPKEGKIPSPPVKEKELSSTPNNERSSKKSKNNYSSPGGAILDNATPVVANKPKKASSSPKPSNRTKKKDTVKTEKSFSKKHDTKSSSHQEEKAKPVYKSRSFIESSSEDDSDLEFPPPAPEPRKKISPKIPPIRKDSVSSQSSAYSEVHSNITSDDEKPSPVPTKVAAHSSSSDSSADEREMSGFPAENLSKISVISPIGERSHSNTENTIDATQAYQDMQMSSSSDESPFLEHGDGEKHHYNNEKHPHHPPDDDNQARDSSSKILQDLRFPNDLNTSSSDEEPVSPLEKPFQNNNDVVDAAHNSENLHHDEHGSSPSQNPELPNVLICEGIENNHYPNMNDTLYRELQELQRKLSFVTDVNRLRKIAAIVAKSHNLLKNNEYFDFDLCSLDQKTISKIQKQLKAV